MDERMALLVRGWLLQVEIDVEGMKAKNKEREANGYSLAYDEDAFYGKIAEIDKILDNIR